MKNKEFQETVVRHIKQIETIVKKRKNKNQKIHILALARNGHKRIFNIELQETPEYVCENQHDILFLLGEKFHESGFKPVSIYYTMPIIYLQQNIRLHPTKASIIMASCVDGSNCVAISKIQTKNGKPNLERFDIFENLQPNFSVSFYNGYLEAHKNYISQYN